jgi:hypothetical protein
LLKRYSAFGHGPNVNVRKQQPLAPRLHSFDHPFTHVYCAACYKTTTLIVDFFPNKWRKSTSAQETATQETVTSLAANLVQTVLATFTQRFFDFQLCLFFGAGWENQKFFS